MTATTEAQLRQDLADCYKLFDWLVKSQNGSGGLDKLFDKIKGPWKDAAYTKIFGKGADLAGNPIIH